MTKHILISTGEASGDLHAAKLIRAVKELDNNISFSGMGGNNMRAAGADIIVDTKSMGVMGLFDVLAELPRILRAMFTMRRFLFKHKPDLLIVIDYSGFHLRLIKFAKKAGVKVLYYIPPQLWASRTHRIKAVKKYVDKIAVILPFEVEFYRKFGLEAQFVGHPLANEGVPTMSVTAAKERFNLPQGKRVVGIFPGSRKGEIKKMLPELLKAALMLKNRFADLDFVLPLASTLTREELQPYLDKVKVPVKIIDENVYDVMQVCDAIMAVSGTVTLQIALMQVPLVIIYKINPPYFPLKIFVKTPYIGLCNVMAQKGIAKEFWQQHVTAKNLFREVEHILTDTNYRENMKKELGQVKASLSGENQYDIAELVVGMI